MKRSLYVKGELLEKDQTAVAIVGTRHPTSNGQKIAYKFSFEIAQQGITIVSGLARGIDTIAHEAALEAKGRTIAVLGSGLDIIYPPENKDLTEKITKNGALVSPFPYGTKPLGQNFLERNELIVKLSLAILVVEGKERSGTLSTANHAANLGVEVFAIPGPINSPQSFIPNYLIDNGASVAKSPQDIIDYIDSLQ